MAKSIYLIINKDSSMHYLPMTDKEIAAKLCDILNLMYDTTAIECKEIRLDAPLFARVECEVEGPKATITHMKLVDETKERVEISECLGHHLVTLIRVLPVNYTPHLFRKTSEERAVIEWLNRE